MKNNIGLKLLFLLFASILIYPSLASFYNEIHQGKEAEVYEERCTKSSQGALKQSYENARRYNEALFENTEAQLSYRDQLSDGNGMACIEIEKIGLKLLVYHGTDDETLQNGVGHLEGSSLPIGGRNTHAILTGHTGLVGKRLFTDLDLLEITDRFKIHVLNNTLIYQIEEIRITQSQDLKGTEIIEGKDCVSLVTCTPYGVNDHRLWIKGTRVYEQKETEKETTVCKQMIQMKDVLKYMGYLLTGWLFEMIFVKKERP